MSRPLRSRALIAAAKGLDRLQGRRRNPKTFDDLRSLGLIPDDEAQTPDMMSAMLTALTPSLQPTGEHRLLPDGYCPDCGGQCIREWLGRDPEPSGRDPLT